ncbi:probable leucine aminopeptidase 1 [Folsomia candida]|uniref:Putative leucine aminopeptidase 1 n=1 Tax=Folsomia candida TaxID=158441 RepID=A0A226F7A1_FOLCA|nr:probable leucine aminopeptidase 1 [Folsomia candida]OXA65091.1 putative leucine aminopeptidase 1 [Folsomia candida]
MRVIKFVVVIASLSVVVARPSLKDGKRLIKTSETDAGFWLTKDEIFSLIKQGINFVDVTESKFPNGVNTTISGQEIPSSLRYQNVVHNAFENIDILRMQTFVDRFDNFPNRYFNNQNGVDAADWVERMVKIAITDGAYGGKVTVEKFTHSWPQSSIIARIEGADPVLKEEVVIFGAHFDSINSADPVDGIAPGSDDNGSGSVTLFESLRVLIESGIIPKRTIEFQWYAAEEVGLRGSGDIAEAYYIQGVKVVAMVNYDVVGYRAGATQIGLLTDNTSPTLTALLRLVIDKYCTIPWINHQCGYGCSDHASFTRHGFPAASPSEYPMNPNMHKEIDTAEKMSFEQLAEFVKLTVGTAVEIAEVQET